MDRSRASVGPAAAEPETAPAAVQMPGPSAALAERVLALQRTAGNAAVARWVDTLHDTGETDGVPESLRGGPRGRYGIRTPIVPEFLVQLSPNPTDRDSAPRSGPAFVQGRGDAAGADPDDVRQGRLGDCWLMAAIAAVARANPALIESMVRPNGDGTYNVTLHVGPNGEFLGQGSSTVVRVDSSFPVGGAQHGDVSPTEGPELWVMLIEKAYAVNFGGGHVEALEGGGGSSAVYGLTGISSQGYDPSGRTADEVLTDLQTALDEHRAATAFTPSAFAEDLLPLARARHVIANHAYAVSGADPAAGTVDLQNPQGSPHLIGLPVPIFQRLFERYAFTAESLEGQLAPRPPQPGVGAMP